MAAATPMWIHECDREMQRPLTAKELIRDEVKNTTIAFLTECQRVFDLELR